MVERVKQGSLEGMADLHTLVRRTAEPYFRGQFDAQEAEKRVQDLFLVVLEAVRDGALLDARQLNGFVRTVVRYHALAETRRTFPESSVADAGGAYAHYPHY